MSYFEYIEKKPCHYCGKDVITFDQNAIGQIFAYCWSCGAQGPTAATVEEAAEKWNAPGSVVTALEKRIEELEKHTVKIKPTEETPTYYCMSVDVSSGTISVSSEQKIESELRTKIASLEENIKELYCDLEAWRDQLGEE